MVGVRRIMPAGQIAVCITLLTGAALLVRTVRNLYAINTGMSIDRLATVDIGQPANLGAPSALPDVYRDLVTTVKNVPGVEGAAMDAGGPLAGGSNTAIALPEQPDRTMQAVIRPVTPGWFDIVQLPMAQGAPFRDGDWEFGIRMALAACAPTGRCPARSPAPDVHAQWESIASWRSAPP